MKNPKLGRTDNYNTNSKKNKKESRHILSIYGNKMSQQDGKDVTSVRNWTWSPTHRMGRGERDLD